MSALNRLGATLRTAGTEVKKAVLRVTIPAFRQKELFEAAVAATAMEPAIKAALIARGLRGQTPQAAIRYAADLRDVCFAASRMGNPDASKRVPQLVRSNVPIESVRADLVNARADASEAVELVTVIPDQGARRVGTSASDIYAARAASTKPNSGSPSRRRKKKRGQ